MKSHIILFMLMMILLSCSSSSNLLNHDQVTIVIEKPKTEVVEPATQKKRSYHPSEKQYIWIERIDGKDVKKKPKKVAHQAQVYYLTPGVHQIELMFEGSGISARYIPMFTDSVFMKFEYSNKLKNPVLIDLETQAGEIYKIITEIKSGKCILKVTKNDFVVAQNSSNLKYKYSNVFDPANWHLNKDVEVNHHSN